MGRHSLREHDQIFRCESKSFIAVVANKRCDFRSIWPRIRSGRRDSSVAWHLCLRDTARDFLLVPRVSLESERNETRTVQRPQKRYKFHRPNDGMTEMSIQTP